MIQVTHQLRAFEGKCKNTGTNDQRSIENTDGKRLAYGFKDRWKLSKGIACKTPGGEKTERDIQFGGRSKKYNRDAYIFVMDLSYEDHYPNSVFRAKRVNLGKTEMRISENEKGLEFLWGNGASVIVDINSGELIESSILSDSTIDPNKCSTKKYYSNRRPRMIPNLSLKKAFRHLKVTKPRNI